MPQFPALAPTPAYEVKVRAGPSTAPESPSPPGELHKKTLMQPQQQQLPEITQSNAEDQTKPISTPSHSCAQAGAPPCSTEERGGRGHTATSPPVGPCCSTPQGCTPRLLSTHAVCAPGSPAQCGIPGSHQEHTRTRLSAAVGVWPQAALASPGNTVFLQRSSTSSSFNLVLLKALEPWMPNAII